MSSECLKALARNEDYDSTAAGAIQPEIKTSLFTQKKRNWIVLKCVYLINIYILFTFLHILNTFSIALFAYWIKVLKVYENIQILQTPINLISSILNHYKDYKHLCQLCI